MRYIDQYQEKQSDRFLKTLQDFCKRKQQKTGTVVRPRQHVLKQCEAVSKTSR